MAMRVDAYVCITPSVGDGLISERLALQWAGQREPFGR